MPGEAELLRTLYREFNAHNIDAVLANMHPDVVWPNKWEGGTVYGREGVRDYWTRQWAVLNPHVEPLEIKADAKAPGGSKSGRLSMTWTESD